MEGNKELLVSYEADGSEIKLSPRIVKEYLTGGADITMQEFKQFAELCKVRKLNPFLKEAYVIKFGSLPAQIVVGKDAIIKRAVLHKDFDGREQGIIIQDKKGEIVERNGTFKTNEEQLLGGWAKVYRKSWDKPVYITVAFDEVAQTKKSGELNSNWANKGATMVEKVALVRALREAFVEDFGGMIDESEAWRNEDLNQNKPSFPKLTDEVFNKYKENWKGAIISEQITVKDLENKLESKYEVPLPTKFLSEIHKWGKEIVVEAEEVDGVEK
jgi:phage recombination protein Bet